MGCPDTELLAERVRQMHACLEQLHALAVRQVQLIDEEQFTELLGTLAAKQQLLGQFHTLVRGLGATGDRLPEEPCWAAGESREQCRAMLDRCRVLLAEALEHGERSEARLAQQREHVARRLADARRGDVVRSAYRTSSARHDLSCEA
jgi:hypothetical protein